MNYFATVRTVRFRIIKPNATTAAPRFIGNSRCCSSGPLVSPGWQSSCVNSPAIPPEDAMNSRNYDDWTIERWRVEPRISKLEFEDLPSTEQAPPLWKDLALATALAVVLWVAAAVIFG
jgi:hypothetical protein